MLFVDDKPLTVELPSAVTLKVADARRGHPRRHREQRPEAGDLETGLMVQAPLFVKKGELIQVSTADGSYLGRA